MSKEGSFYFFSYLFSNKNKKMFRKHRLLVNGQVDFLRFFAYLNIK